MNEKLPNKPVITENLLPDDLCRSLIEEFQHKSEVDYTNHHRGSIRGGIPSYAPGVGNLRGDTHREDFKSSSYVLVNDITGRTKEKLFKVMRENNMPFSSKSSCMFYRWSTFSYYPTHADMGMARLASIYLNEDYRTCDGGMYLYKDDERNEWIGIEPSFNKSVYFDQTNHPEGTLHMVTPVTSRKERMSIQMFEEM